MNQKFYPNGAVIDLTTICPAHCFFCYRANKNEIKKVSNFKNQTMKFDIYKRIIDELVNYDTITWISLSGSSGEPLMIENLHDYSIYAREKKHFTDIVINTVGFNVNQQNVAKLLNSFTEISISLDSLDANSYSMIHPPLDYHKIVKNIHTLLNVKNEIKSQCTIKIRFTENEYNTGQYELFENYWKQYNVETYWRRKHSFIDIIKEMSNINGRINCNQPEKIVNVTIDGEITTCCLNYNRNPTFGSLLEKPLSAIWNSYEMNNWRTNRLHTTCKNCSGLGKISQHKNI